jgi:hypothetical protein
MTLKDNNVYQDKLAMAYKLGAEDAKSDLGATLGAGIGAGAAGYSALAGGGFNPFHRVPMTDMMRGDGLQGIKDYARMYNRRAGINAAESVLHFGPWPNNTLRKSLKGFAGSPLTKALATGTAAYLGGKWLLGD